MITATQVSKKFGDVAALDGVSFTVKRGTVAGFLGPNGAGKSTMLRCLVGLTTPTSGQTTILGEPYRKLPNPAVHVGVLLDATAMHKGRTGTETLRLAALTLGLPSSRIGEVLDLVQLTRKEGQQRVGTYSLGMRQRLGIAQAVLGNPQVLLLDEPVNGLDPHGILWMRSFLRQFATDGGTVLLSSHLLNEIERVADHIIMINKGRIVADGLAEDLVRTHGDLDSLFLNLATSRTAITPADTTDSGATR